MLFYWNKEIFKEYMNLKSPSSYNAPRELVHINVYLSWSVKTDLNMLILCLVLFLLSLLFVSSMFYTIKWKCIDKISNCM